MFRQFSALCLGLVFGVARAEGDLERLARQLATPGEVPQMEAARGLGDFGPDAVPALCRALRDPNVGVRFAAAEGLGKIGVEAVAARPDLRRATNNVDPRVRHAAVSTLREIGPAAYPELAEAVVKGDIVVYSEALSRLCSDTEAAEELARLLNLDSSSATQAERALHYLDPKRGGPLVPHLERLLRGPDGYPRDAAVRLVRYAGPSPVRLLPPLLADLRRRNDPERVTAALWAIRYIGPTAADAVPDLIECLGRPGPIGPQASDALTAVGQAAIPALTRAAAEGSSAARRDAIAALGGPGVAARPAAGVILSALRPDANPSLAESVAYSLGELFKGATPEETRPVVQILVPMLGEAHPPKWRMLAAQILSNIGLPAREAAPAVAAHLDDDSVTVAFASALVQLEPRRSSEAVASLRARVADPTFGERHSAAALLGYIGDDARVAVPDLRAIVSAARPEPHRPSILDPPPNLPREAAIALVRIDPDAAVLALEWLSPTAAPSRVGERSFRFAFTYATNRAPESFRRGLASPDPATRRFVATYAAALPPADAVPVLRAALLSPDAAVRNAGAAGLADLSLLASASRDASAALPELRRLRATDAAVRPAAAAAIRLTLSFEAGRAHRAAASAH